jgi:hypothetical protein
VERSRRCLPTTRDGFWNNASIVKLQYQHNIGSNAYFRIYGYTFYSDWLQTSALSYGTPFYGFGVPQYDYELESHTRGLAFTFADQLSSAQHLLTFDVNYTTARRTASTTRTSTTSSDRGDEPNQRHRVLRLADGQHIRRASL